MITFRLTVDEIEWDGTERPAFVKKNLLTAEGDEELLTGLYDHLTKTTLHRVRLVKVDRTERHETVQFRRSTVDSPFIT